MKIRILQSVQLEKMLKIPEQNKNNNFFLVNAIVLTLLVVDLALLLSRVVGCDLEQTLDVPQEGLCGGDAGVHANPNSYPRRNSSRCYRR